MNSSNRDSLRVAWCDHKAASFAVTHWHYSKCMPSGRLVMFGAWEDGKFIGCVIFGRGAIHHIGKPFGVTQSQACELVRVAFGRHRTAISRILAICMRQLRAHNPGLRVVISYADSDQGHHGGIYQAGNWAYIGDSMDAHLIIHGKREHPRSVNAKYGTRSLAWICENVDKNAHYMDSKPKHKYVMPLDASMRTTVLRMAKPYPRRATSIGVDAPGFQPGEGSSQLTVALHGNPMATQTADAAALAAGLQ